MHIKHVLHMLHIYVYSANIATLSCHRSTRNAAAAEVPGCRAAKTADWLWRCPWVAIPRNSLSDSPCPLGSARGRSRYNLLSLAIKNKPFQCSNGRNSQQQCCSVKFEYIPLFYQHCCAAPLWGIAPIATLERFVVYC